MRRFLLLFGRNGEMIDHHAGFKMKQRDNNEATTWAALKLEREE